MLKMRPPPGVYASTLTLSCTCFVLVLQPIRGSCMPSAHGCPRAQNQSQT